MKKLYLIILILTTISVTSVIGYTFIFNDGKLPLPPLNEPGTASYEYQQGVEVFPGIYLETSFNDYTQDFRPLYPNMTEEQYAYFFSELPEFPEDFFSISQLVFDGLLTDYSRISSEYWKQPEFYNGWFSSVNTSYINNDPRMETVEGYGCYPAIKEITVNKGKTVTVNCYLHAAYGVERYQGLIIHPYLPDSAISLRGTTLFEQQETVNSYLSVSITNPDNPIYESFKSTLPYNNVGEEDWFLIFKPTYQLLFDKYNEPIAESGFSLDWTRIVELEIDIDPSTPSGDYVIALEMLTPCFEINQEFYFSTSHDYYGTKYQPAGGYYKTSTPHFQCILHIS